MFLSVLLFTFVGIGAGVLVGLVPGIHPNTVFAVMLPMIALAGATGSYPLIAFIVSISLANTVSSFIPSIFIGAPEADTSLSVLPGHRMLLKGEGYSALFMTVAGSMCATVMTVAALPLLLFTIPLLYSGIHSYTHILLILVFAALVMMERGKKKLYAAFIFISTGIAGTMLLYSMPSETVLFPALSGLFGIPMLLIGLRAGSRLPRQKSGKKPSAKVVRGSVAGWSAGLLVGLLPGIGSAQAGVLSGTALRGKQKDFMVSLGGIGAANILFTFIALYTISKARSGAAAAIEELWGAISTTDVAFIMAVALFSCFISCLLTLSIGRRTAHALSGMEYKKVNVVVLASLAVMIPILSGPAGAAVAALMTILGLSCAFLDVKRMYLMGFLMLPTILFFSGLIPGFLLLAVP
jgi:putative membrane protein